MTLRAKPIFRVHQHESRESWIEIAYWSNDDGMPMDLFGLDLPQGTTFEKAQEVAAFLRENIEYFTYTKTT
ncbi:hypothetical protein BWR59_17195 [Pseudomonas sp. Bc-h]|uniref:hypothetical protein n=1 Tax=Pseudomonas sp. Bc-h TaxID=1943632 RepID=UPI0009D956FE|nr:hypothetical protein [Pseudomonas sp. Bc-h]OQR30292.1 hypothetical protein BWR59_17195 [Pseudomonas sp. Bc-h]